MTMNMRAWAVMICALLVYAMGHRPARALPITAFFDEGNTTSEVDAWPGQAGEGWVNAWNSNFQGGDDSTFDQTVIDTSPLLAGTGNYLFLDYTNKRSGSRSAHVNRRFDFAEMGSAVFEVEFLFRLETDPGSEAFAAFFFSGNNTSLPIAQVPSSAAAGQRPATWGLYAQSTITFLDGLVDTNSYHYVDSGIALVHDEIYHFHFVVDTASQTYTASVSNLTAQVGYTSGTLAFGETYDPEEGGSYDANQLSWTLRAGPGNVTPSVLQASLDSITIIPEPSSLGLLLAALVFRNAWRRRRR